MNYQAWQQVKVTSEGSGFFGQAGVVVRTEKEKKSVKVFVKLDADGSIEGFDPSELVVLG